MITSLVLVHLHPVIISVLVIIFEIKLSAHYITFMVCDHSSVLSAPDFIFVHNFLPEPMLFQVFWNRHYFKYCAVRNFPMDKRFTETSSVIFRFAYKPKPTQKSMRMIAPSWLLIYFGGIPVNSLQYPEFAFSLPLAGWATRSNSTSTSLLRGCSLRESFVLFHFVLRLRGLKTRASNLRLCSRPIRPQTVSSCAIVRTLVFASCALACVQINSTGRNNNKPAAFQETLPYRNVHRRFPSKRFTCGPAFVHVAYLGQNISS